MSAIKPPDGRGTGGGVPAASGQGAAGAAPAGAADFREALARAQGAVAGEAAQAAAQSPSAATGGDPVGELAGLLRSGALTPDQALDRLVDRALGQVGRGLSDARRAELAVVLRTALEADPALQALRDDLGR